MIEKFCFFCRQIIETDQSERFVEHTMNFPVVVIVDGEKIIGEKHCPGSGMTQEEQRKELE